MTVKQAVLYNALSAMLAYLGMATGILIGHYADNVSMWIFALTAGLFMYVALVDMVSICLLTLIDINSIPILNRNTSFGMLMRYSYGNTSLALTSEYAYSLANRSSD